MEAIENVTVLTYFSCMQFIQSLGQIRFEQQNPCCMFFLAIYATTSRTMTRIIEPLWKMGRKCVYPIGCHGSITAVTTAGVNSHRNDADCNLSYQRQKTDDAGSEWLYALWEWDASLKICIDHFNSSSDALTEIHHTGLYSEECPRGKFEVV